MKSFLVNKSDTFNAQYSPVVNFDAGFLFLGDFLIVGNDTITHAKIDQEEG
jgi:hypothetical protein